ncbi:cyclic pyranopterin monophosphate synthase MoaC [Luteococcus sp. OSA5]|uniref:cyclic pyranopterin monophosphate synthase MoaC n=1 Tax=Luteococcus sp. OSA5 TaxID=3401630 RepID=UPI003B4373F1
MTDRRVFRPSSVDDFVPEVPRARDDDVTHPMPRRMPEPDLPGSQTDAEPTMDPPSEPAAVPEGSQPFPHLSGSGEARMVDVSAKQVTARSATARGMVLLSQECLAALRDETLPKGDALAVARIAGVMGAKKTSDLIPLCHPLPLTGVDVTLEQQEQGIEITATVRTTHRTGVEMEALTAVCTAALGLVDMVKAVDKHARLTDVRVTAKSGGRSGDWTEQ